MKLIEQAEALADTTTGNNFSPNQRSAISKEGYAGLTHSVGAVLEFSLAELG